MAGKKVGRPSSYNDAVAHEICAQLARGNPLTAVCRQEGMPDLVTVYKWMRDFPEFLKLAARAREDSADTLAAEIMEIADDARNDFKQIVGKNGELETVVDREAIERSRLRIDARKWIAAKLKPRKYGDLQRLEVNGEMQHVVDVGSFDRIASKLEHALSESPVIDPTQH